MATPSVTNSSRTPKLYPATTLKRRRTLLPVVVVMLVIAIWLQVKIDPLHDQYVPKSKISAVGGLNNEFLLLPLLGFREAAAGLLWVRCDEFFHSGDYDAILPLVRVITWLDPHADNIYVTGAWHLAYNFTDSSERSDRRYIEPSEALLTEGIENNESIPDIKFEKGWQNYDKIKNYPVAIASFLDAIHTKPNPDSQDYPYGAPIKTWHMLAHAYEKAGMIPEALAAWKRAMEVSDSFLKKNSKDFSNMMLSSAEHHNYAETLQRYNDRFTTEKHSGNNPSDLRGIDWPHTGNPKPGPWDVSLRAQPGRPMIDVERPKGSKIAGLFNSADESRVDVLISDWDYKPHISANNTSAFAVDSDQTILMDSMAVRKNAFEREFDMSKDPKMYGFAHDYYRIVLSYNSRATSPHLQDRFGWSGEGLIDGNPANNFVDSSPEKLGTTLVGDRDGTGQPWDGVTLPVFEDKEMPALPHGQPQRTVKIVFKVSKEQLMGRGKPITDADIVPNTE